VWSPKGTTLRVIRCPTLQVSQFLFPGQRSDTFLTDHVRGPGLFTEIHGLCVLALCTELHRSFQIITTVFVQESGTFPKFHYQVHKSTTGPNLIQTNSICPLIFIRRVRKIAKKPLLASSRLSVCPPVRKELGSHGTNFHEMFMFYYFFYL